MLHLARPAPQLACRGCAVDFRPVIRDDSRAGGDRTCSTADPTHGRLAVNLSAIQLTHEKLPERVQAIMDESGFPMNHLEFEITESAVMSNQQRAVDNMQKLQSWGIHLSIDDFGTGYSSLSYLKGFPINTLKIDRSFVQDLEKSLKDKSIVASIISLAHHLKLTVVAEGVETDEQHRLLKELHCEEMQGFLFSRPLIGEELERLLLETRKQL